MTAARQKRKQYRASSGAGLVLALSAADTDRLTAEAERKWPAVVRTLSP